MGSGGSVAGAPEPQRVGTWLAFGTAHKHLPVRGPMEARSSRHLMSPVSTVCNVDITEFQTICAIFADLFHASRATRLFMLLMHSGDLVPKDVNAAVAMINELSR